MGKAFCGPSVKKIRNFLTFPNPKNYVNQSLVMPGMSELGWDIHAPWVKVTEANLQRDREKALPILATLAVLAYHRAPSICNFRQAPGTVLQRDQVAQYIQDECVLRLGVTDG